MKRWSFIIVILCIGVLVSAVLIAYQKKFPFEWIKCRIITSIEEQINADVHIDKVSFGFPNSIILSGIKVRPITSKHLLATAKEVILKYDLKNLVFRKNVAYYGIDKIVIILPEIYLFRSKSGRWNIEDLFNQKKTEQKSPEFLVFTKNGRLTIHDELCGITTIVSQLEISYINTVLDIKGLVGRQDTRTYPIPVHFKATLHAICPVDATWEIKMSNADIGEYSPYLRTPLGQIIDGSVSVALRGRVSYLDKIKVDNTWNMFGSYTIYALTGQMEIKNGRMKLKHSKLTCDDINGKFKFISSRHVLSAPDRVLEFSDVPVTTIKTSNLSFKFLDVSINTAVIVTNISNPEILLDITTSKFKASNLKYITDIDKLNRYLSTLNFKTQLMFKGKINIADRSISGELKSRNYAGRLRFTGNAEFIFRRGIFESVRLTIDENTSVIGRICLSAEEDSDFIVKCKRARVLPLIMLSGIKELRDIDELKVGRISGKLRIKPECYYGNITLLTYGLIDKIYVDIDSKRGIWANIIQQRHGRINVKTKLLPQKFHIKQVDICVDNFLFNYTKYSFDGLWCSGTSTISDVITGKLTISNIVINNISYPDWHTYLKFYNQARRLEITSPVPQKLLVNGSIVLKRYGNIDVDITFDKIKLKLISQLLDGDATGKVYLKGRLGKGIVISGNGICIEESSLFQMEPVNVNLAITKRKNMLNISYLALKQPHSNARAYLSGILTTYKGKLKTIDLHTQINNISIGNVYATLTANYKAKADKGSIKGRLLISKGNIGGMDISSGNITIAQIKGVHVISGDMRVGRRGILRCSGKYEPENLTITGEFCINNVNFEELPWKYFDDWYGELTIAGNIEGQINMPCISAEFNSAKFYIGDEFVEHLMGNICYASNILLIDTNFNNELFITGRVGGDGYLTVRLIEGRLYLLAKVLGLPSLRLYGLMNGELSFTGTLDNPYISGIIEVKEFASYGVYADVIKAKIILEDNVFSTPEFCFYQGDTGVLDVKECMVEFIPNGRIIFEAEAKTFKVANMVLSGLLSSKGTITIGEKAILTVNTEDVVINQLYSIRNLSTNVLIVAGKFLEFIRQPAENSISGKIKFISKDEVLVEGFGLFSNNRRILDITGWANFAMNKFDVGIIMDKADLGLLSLYMPNIKKPKGFVDGNLHLGGKIDDPTIDGSLIISGSLETYPFGARIRNLYGELHVINNSIILRNLSANIGRGRLTVTSRKPFTIADLDIYIKSEDAPLPVLIPGLIESYGRYGGAIIDIKIKGHVLSPIATGEIIISKANFTYPPEERIRKEQGYIEFFRRMKWDIMLIGKRHIRYYNDYVSVYLKKNAWLRIIKDDKGVCITGKIFAKRGGVVDYLGTEFILKKGYLEFRRDEPMPYLYAYAQTRIGKRKITLSHKGYLYSTDLVLTATGYPPLSQEEIIRLLLSSRGRRAYERLTTDDLQALFEIGSKRIFGKEITDAILIPIERKISRLLSIDLDVRLPFIERIIEQTLFEEDIAEESIFARTSVKIGKFIGDNLYISYKGILSTWSREEDKEIKHPRIRLKEEIGLEYYLSDTTTIKYRFIPSYDWSEQEYEITLEREIRF